MSDDLFDKLKRKEKKKSLIESLIDVGKPEEEKKDDFIEESEIDKKEDVLFDDVVDSSDSDIQTSSASLEDDFIGDSNEVSSSNLFDEDVDKGELSGASGMRVLSFDEDESDDVESTEKTIKITAANTEELRKIEYVVYLLSSGKLQEAVDYITNWDTN